MPFQDEFGEALSESDITAQYLAQLGIPAFGASPFQRWQTRQALPTAAAYMMADRPAREAGGGISFADYLRNAGIMGARQAIPALYNQMMAQEPTSPWGAEGTRKSLGGLWDDLMKAVSTAKYGRFAGPTFAGAMPQMQATYEVSPEGFQGPGEASFLQYLRRRYGL